MHRVHDPDQMNACLNALRSGWDRIEWPSEGTADCHFTRLVNRVAMPRWRPWRAALRTVSCREQAEISRQRSLAWQLLRTLKNSS